MQSFVPMSASPQQGQNCSTPADASYGCVDWFIYPDEDDKVQALGDESPSS